MSIKIAIKSDSTLNEGGETEPGVYGTWETMSEEWVNNPADGQPWEKSDIDDLQIGLAMRSGTLAPVMCTQVYVVVYYTPPVAAPRHGFVNFQVPGVV